MYSHRNSNIETRPSWGQTSSPSRRRGEVIDTGVGVLIDTTIGASESVRELLLAPTFAFS